MAVTVKEVQEALAELGFYTGNIDDAWGELTAQAVSKFQYINGLPENGKISTKLLDLLFEDIEDRAAEPTPFSQPQEPTAPTSHWPRDDQDSLGRFYGAPGTNQIKIKTAYPLRLAWDLNTVLDGFSCHQLVATSMEQIFAETLAHYGLDKIKELRLDRFGGCLNVRRIRGGKRLSTHAWGIAVDIDPANNQLRQTSVEASLAKPEYDPFWQIIESTGATSLGRTKNYDWMHFQFAGI